MVEYEVPSRRTASTERPDQPAVSRRGRRVLRTWWHRFAQREYRLAVRDCEVVITGRAEGKDQATVDAIRSDVVAASIWTARFGSLLAFAKIAYSGVMESGWLVAAAVAVVAETQAPSWAWIWLTLSMLVCLAFHVPDELGRRLDGPERESRQTISDNALLVSLLISVVLLLWWDRFQWVEVLDALVRAVWVAAVCLGTVVATEGVDRGLSKWATSRWLIAELFVLIALATTVALILPDMTFWRYDVDKGLLLLLVVPVCIALLLPVVELAHRAIVSIMGNVKLRRIAAAEFTQSSVWVLTRSRLSYEGPALEDSQPEPASRSNGTLPEQWVGTPAQRRELADRLAYLAKVCELWLPRTVPVVDEREAREVRHLFVRKAAALRSARADILLGRRDPDAEFWDDVWHLATAGAERRWALLPDASDSEEAVSVIRRWTDRLRSVLVALVPLAGSAVALWLGQPEVAGSLAVVTLIVLLDMASPGSVDKLAGATAHSSRITGLMRH